MVAVTAYSRIDGNDFEKTVPLSQTGAGVTPINLKLDDGDVAAKIMQLQVSSGVQLSERFLRLDRQDWERAMTRIHQALNTRAVALSIANPAVVTLATHGFAANQPFRFSTTGTLPTGVSAGTTYYVSAVGGPPAGTFQFSTVPGGPSVITTGSQVVTHSVYPV